MTTKMKTTISILAALVMSGLLMFAAATPQVIPLPSLTLTFTDNSTNEDGFKIERGGASASGPFSQLPATLAPNVTTYVDTPLPDATTFCYRVRAFNTGGDSAYSNIACSMTNATLTVTKSGNGIVTGGPINCGPTCAVLVSANTVVTLSAAPSTGFRFAGWTGSCTGISDCSVTMDGRKDITATFAALPQVPPAPTNLGVGP